MKHLIILPLAALALAASASAQTSRTTTIEKPKGTATKTVTRDNGTRTVDATATRNSDGATATRHRERTKTENGVSGSGSQTGFNGKTRSYEYDRTRTEDGWTTTGSRPTKRAAPMNMTLMAARPKPGAKASATSRATASRFTTAGDCRPHRRPDPARRQRHPRSKLSSPQGRTPPVTNPSPIGRGLRKLGDLSPSCSWVRVRALSIAQNPSPTLPKRKR